MGKLILVRHGHTRWNGGRRAAKRLRGWIDIPLDSRGRKEARAASEWLSAHHDVEAVYTSDLVRAWQVAVEIEDCTGVAAVPLQALRPWNVGRLAGRRVDEILETLEILNRHPDISAPEGESYGAFFARFGRQLEELLEVADRSRRSIVAVTHIRNLLATPVLLRKGRAAEVPVDSAEIGTGAAMVLERQGETWLPYMAANAPGANVMGEGFVPALAVAGARAD